jgi:hypothetical protein
LIASLPKRAMCDEPRPLCDATVRPSDPSAREISSTMTAYASVSSPAPPYSSEMLMPRNPSAPSSGMISLGKRCASSHARALGAMRSRAKARAVLWIALCVASSSNVMWIRSRDRHRAAASAGAMPPIVQVRAAFT